MQGLIKDTTIVSQNGMDLHFRPPFALSKVRNLWNYYKPLVNVAKHCKNVANNHYDHRKLVYYFTNRLLAVLEPLN